MAKDKEKQYIYIVQALLEPSKCKIGKTNDLERRLKEYNSMPGKSKENTYQYLFAGEVKNMAQVENDIKEEYMIQREEKSKEIYFFNTPLFKRYVEFITSHNMFVKEIVVKTEPKTEIVKIVKKTTPSLNARGITKKDVMQKAQKAKNDEFFTRYEDIEKEIAMYPTSIWKNKTVFCNCDDAVDDDERNTSAFALFFLQNFKALELKKLICTHYGGGLDLFNQGVKGYVFTKDGFRELKEFPPNYTGSFDDPLSIKILKEEADIVCTNPPFSEAADYWKLVIKSGKKFLIISNITNVKNKPYMQFFMDKKVRPGYNSVDWYYNPKKELVCAAGHWYTNLPVKNRPKYKNIKIMPLKEIPGKYKRYDDKKVLVVDNSYIPADYKKPFAVSVRPLLSGILEMGYKMTQASEYVPYTGGKRRFGRVLIEKIQ